MYLVILSVQPYKTLPATTYICVIEHLHVCHSLPKDGWTPFHAACHEGHAQVAEMLLQAGASVELETEVRWDQIVLGGKNWRLTSGTSWAPSNAVHFLKLFLHISILVLMGNVFLACWHSNFHNNEQPSNQHSFLLHWRNQFYDERNPRLYTLAYNIHGWPS